MERVLGYARVSVPWEDIENQVRAIEEYCQRKGYMLLTVIRDTVTGVSNPLDRQPFRKLLEYASDLNVRKIIVYDISRLGRSLMEIASTLKILEARGLLVEFVKLDYPVAMDRKTFSIFVFAFGLAAEIERLMMKQRLEAARRAGKRIGRPPVEIPIDEVKKYLKMGLSKKDIYNLLVAKGYLKKKDGTPISYVQFLRRLKAEGL